ncbi:MAG: hypothetical protein Q7R49_04660 [Candidatus Daviesbacteria bacterium]|nr:hypothetical protein [Candidatus Daviesbacteria bacterium]
MILQIIPGMIFLILSIVIFTIPGLAILKKLHILSDLSLERYTVATVLGMTVFTLMAYLLAAIHLRFLMWIFPVMGIGYLIFQRKLLPDLNFDLSKKIILPFILVLTFGMIGQVMVNAPSGLMHSDGVYFYSAHGHDGVWHLSLMEELHKDIFPFQDPEFAGHKLQNYHFFVDLLMSETTRLFPFSNLDIYFRFMPILFSLLLGLGGFIFVKNWSKSEWAGLWSMIFIYFCGSFGYILTLIKSHDLGGEATFWVTQTQSILGNPPHAAAFIILTVFMFLLLKYFQEKNTNYLFVAAILGGSVIEFKVYAGVLVLSGLLIIAIWEILFKRSFAILLFFIFTLFLSLAVYLPNSQSSQDFLIWEPWWFIRTMVVVPDRLDWLDLELRRQTYLAEGNLKRVIELESIAFLIFLFGNLGMRFIGFWTVFKMIKKNIFKNSFDLFFLSVTLISFIIPVLFLQKGVAYNSIQFNQYFLLLFGFLAAITTDRLIRLVKLPTLKVVISLLIIIMAVPTQAGLLRNFYKNLPLSKVTVEELSALEFLNNNTMEDAVILTAPFNQYAEGKYYPPMPIYAWGDTGYVPAFSGRKTLISDIEQVKIMGYEPEELINERQVIFESKSIDVVSSFLQKYQVDYVYLESGQKFGVSVDKLPLKSIYQSGDVLIYKVI